MAGENTFNSIASFGTPSPESLAAPAPAPTPVSGFGAPVGVSDMKKASINNTDVKKANVAEKAVQKKGALSGEAPEAIAQREIMKQIIGKEEGIAPQEGNLLEDVRTLTASELRAKYGRDPMDIYAEVNQAQTEVNDLNAVERNINEKVADTALGVISGIGNTVQGITEFGRIATDTIGMRDTLLDMPSKLVSEAAGGIADLAQSGKSASLGQIQELASLEKEVRADESKRQYEEDIANGESNVIANLSRVGRDAISGVEALVDNPATLTDMAAENLPSLATGAIGGKVAATVAMRASLKSRGIADDVIERFIASDRGQKAIMANSVKMQPAISGIQESGGAVSQANEVIENMSHEDLVAGSPEYNELIKTMSPAEAKEVIRSRVAREAGATQFLSGMATGFLTKGFEANPLSIGGSLGQGIRNVASEGVEEGIQGATGSLGQNIAVQRHADENQDILEGVGEQIGEGAVAGLTIAGVTQGPGAATKATYDATKAGINVTVKGASKVTNALSARLNKQVEADSSVSDEAIAAKAETADAAITRLQEAPAQVETPVSPNSPSAPTEPKQAETPLKKMFDETVNVPDDELPQMNARAVALVQDEEGNVPRRRDQLLMSLETKYKEAESDEDKLALASEIYESVKLISGLQSDEMAEYVASQGEEALADFNIMGDYFNSLAKRPAVIEAIQKAQNTSYDTNTQVTEDNAKSIATTAQLSPMNVAPEVGQQVLDLARKRKIQLPESTVKSLETSINISSIATLHSDAVAEVTGATSPTREGYKSADVSKQVLEIGWQGDRSDKKLSITQHVSDIQGLIQSGNFKEANLSMNSFTNFAQTMLNKLSALDQASKENKGRNNKIPYKAWNPSTQRWVNSDDRTDEIDVYGERGMYMIANSDNSFANYRRIFADASATVAFQHVLAKQYPELGIKPLELPKISASVTQRQRKHDLSALKALEGFNPLANTQQATTPAYVAPKPVSKPVVAPKAAPKKVLTREAKRTLIRQMGGAASVKTPLIEEMRVARDYNHEQGKDDISKLDNIVASEYPHLAAVIGTDDTGNYLDPRALIDAMDNEVGGTPQYVSQEQENLALTLEALQDEQNRLDEEADKNAQSENQETKQSSETDSARDDDASQDSESDQESEEASSTEVKLERDLKDKFGDLLEGKFAEYYVNTNNLDSKVAMSDSPLAEATALVEALPETESTKIFKRLLKFAPTVIKELNEAYNKKINSTNKGPEDFVMWNNLRPTIFMRKTENGYEMDQQIAEAAVLAMLSKLLTISPKTSFDMDEALDKAGVSRDDVIGSDGDLGKHLRNTEPMYGVVKDAAKDTMKLLGIKANSEIEEGMTRGPFEALAHQLLVQLEEKTAKGNALINIDTIKVSTQSETDDDTRSFVGVSLGSSLSDEAKKALRKDGSKLGQALFSQRDAVFNINTPPQFLSRKVIRSDIRLSKKQMKAVENQSKIGFTINMPFVSVAEILTPERMKKMRGYRFLDKDSEEYKKMNINDLKAIEGKNQSIDLEMEDTQNAIDEIRAYADLNKLDEEEVPLFHPYGVTSVGRMQAIGPASGQSNKYARAALRSTWATLDLTNQDHKEGFLRTVLQMSGAKVDGKKIEYLHSKDIMDKAEAAVRTKFGPVIDELKKHFEGKDIDPDFIADHKSMQGTEPVVLEALTAMARYELDPTSKAFRHSVPLEADGVTNGPAAVLVKFATGAFDASQIEQFERIGLFFGNKDNKKILADKKAQGDTYSITSDKVAPRMRDRAALLGSKNRDIVLAISRLIRAFPPLGVSEITDAETMRKMLSFDRNAAKNPLTKTTYGAGKMGTARGITGDMLSQIYAKISDMNINGGKWSDNFYEGFGADFGLVIREFTGISKEGNPYRITDKGGKILNIKDLSKLSLDDDAFEAFAKNMAAVYVDPLYESVEDTMGTSFKVMKNIAETIHAQSAVLHGLFQDKMNKLGSKETISPKEFKEWMEQNKRLGGYIDTADQAFFLGGTKDSFTKSDGKDGKQNQRRVAASAADGRKSGFRSLVPGLAKVSTAATVNIGTGDGLMMTEAMAIAEQIEGMDRILQIYDGMEMPADSFRNIGEAMNQAAHAAWFADTAQAILDSAENFARNFKEENIPSSAAAIIMKAIYPTEKVYPATLMGTIEGNLSVLRENVKQIKARHTALKKVATWTDQMSGADSSFFSDGIDAGSSPEAIADTLNRLMQEAETEVAQEAATAAKKDRAALQEAIEAHSFPIRGNVKEMKLQDLNKIADLLNQQGQDFYKYILRSHMPKDIRVVVGPAAELEVYAKDYPHKATKMFRQVNGRYDPVNSIVYLVEDNIDGDFNEVLVHELTHVALASKLEAYYHGDADEVTREAVGRLEALANEFIELNFMHDTPAVKEAVKRLRDYAKNGMNYQALQEIITEMLTNPTLIKVAKQQKVNNPAAKVYHAIMKALRKMFTRMPMTPNESFFEQAKFNIELLSKYSVLPPNGGKPSRGKTVLNQLSKDNPKTERIGQKINDAINARTGNSLFGAAMKNIAQDISTLYYQEMVKSGFEFTPDEAITFAQIATLFSADVPMNGPALVRAQELYEHALENLTVESFMLDPEGTTDMHDRYQAQEKYNALIGLTSDIKRDIKKRSMIMPIFLAMAAANKEVAAVLDQIPAPPKEALTYGSVDEALTSVATRALDELTNLAVGELKGSSLSDAVDNVIGKLADYESEKQSRLEEMYQGVYNQIDDKAAGLLKDGATVVSDKLLDIGRGIKEPAAALPVITAGKMVGMFTDKAGSFLEGYTSILNEAKMPTFITELFAEFRGRTPSNAKIYDLINKVRFAVSSIREEYREQYPKIIANKFSRKLTKGEWTALHTAIGKADIVALMDQFSMSDISRLYNSDNARKAKINHLSRGLTNRQIQKATELADFLVNGKRSHMILRNAYAISQTSKGTSEKQIDALTSLIAIEKMDEDTRKTVSELFVKEFDGMDFAAAQMQHFKRAENGKYETNELIRLNQWKGYIPSEAGVGVHVTLADETDHKKMVLMGYEKIGEHDGKDRFGRTMNIYRTNVSSQNPYTQGVTQTVQASQNGIDIRTGRTVSGITSGSLTGALMKSTLERMKLNGTQDPALLPVFNGEGEIIALERVIAPEHMATRNNNTHFGEMLGSMAGRQVEESQAMKFNGEIAKLIVEQYNTETDRHNEYVNIATSKDPVHKDTWNSIPRDMKADLTKAFGKSDFFPIRADMIPMVVGYRNPGASDLWTGVSRIPEDARKVITNTLQGVFGRKAYKYINTASDFWTTVISEAKTLIVVKSFVVPAANLASNILQLMNHGVPLRSINVKGIKKFHEINQYLINQDKIINLGAEANAERDQIKKESLLNQIDTIRSNNRRMSIWPLIEAGAFSTITEGLTDIDTSLKEGRFGDWVEAQVEKLPDGVKTIGKYAVVSKGTALYKGLNRATQYGDFLAKAILYDDMIERQKMNQAEALAEISEEFVNYNVPAGRLRTGMENFGLAWFHNYKIRSLKPAIKNLRKNPVRAFMGLGMVSQVSWLGSPLSDNALAVAADGRLWNSMGTDMLFRAPELNPWYALTR